MLNLQVGRSLGPRTVDRDVCQMSKSVKTLIPCVRDFDSSYVLCDFEKTPWVFHYNFRALQMRVLCGCKFADGVFMMSYRLNKLC